MEEGYDDNEIIETMKNNTEHEQLVDKNWEVDNIERVKEAEQEFLLAEIKKNSKTKQLKIPSE